MKYFQTDKDGFLVGEFQAEISPLEPGFDPASVPDLDPGQEPGVYVPPVYLIPGGGVEISPPVVGVNQAARWVNGQWEIVPDFLGAVYFLGDHSRNEIKARGVALPVGALATNPPDTAAETTAKTRADAIRELAAIDLASIRSMREWIVAQASAPQIIKDHSAAAAAARAKL